MALTDTLFLGAAIVIVAISAFFGYVLFNEASKALAGTNPALSSGFAQQRDTFKIFDWLIVFAFFGLMLGALASAFVVNSHPVFTIFGIVFTLVTIAITPVFSNVVAGVLSNSYFADVLTNFPLLTGRYGLFQNFPLVMLIMQVLIIIVMYMKGRNDQGYYYG